MRDVEDAYFAIITLHIVAWVSVVIKALHY